MDGNVDGDGSYGSFGDGNFVENWYEKIEKGDNPATGNVYRFVYGSSGEEVLQLQRLLLWLGYINPQDTLDGFFGTKVQGSVNAIKADLGLNQNGIVDQQTWEAIIDKWNDEKSYILSHAPSGAPDEYKPFLAAFKIKHPEWNIICYEAGMTFEEFVEGHYDMTTYYENLGRRGPYSLTDEAKYYDSSDETIYEGPDWRKATREGISFYGNPINAFDYQHIYQFVSIEYCGGETEDGVSAILSGTSLEQYADVFFEQAHIHGVSAYFLAAKAMIETACGTSTLAQGIEYDGMIVYNYFGIGANTGTPEEAGAEFAAKLSVEYFYGPWDSPEDAIAGGAKFFKDRYIDKGQNSLYTIRFNLESYDAEGDQYGNKFSNEYAANIAMAYSEGQIFAQAFSVYDNIPLTLMIPYFLD